LRSVDRSHGGRSHGGRSYGGRSHAGRSHVDALLGMALQIPAGLVSLAGEERIDAGLRLGRVEDEFRLAAFLRYRVVAGDSDLSVGLAIGGDPVAEHGVVDRVGQGRHDQRGREPNHDHSLQPMFDSGA